MVNAVEESPESVYCLYLSSKILPFSLEGKDDRTGTFSDLFGKVSNFSNMWEIGSNVWTI